MYIAHATLFVNDQERAKNFFVEKLGWEVTNDAPMGPDMRWVSVAPKGRETGLVLLKNMANWSAEKVGGGSGIAIEVDDVFATAADLKAKGVEFDTEPINEFFGGWAVFKDSEGNEIGLHSPVKAGSAT